MSYEPLGHDESRFYQSRQQARTTAVLELIGLAIIVYVAVSIAKAHPHHGMPDRRLAGAIILGVVAVVGLTLGIRVLIAGVLVTSQAVTIRNPIRSIHLSWGEIEEFSVEPNGPWSIACAVLKDGRKVKIWGIQGQMRSMFPKSRWATEAVDELNALLRERVERAQH